MKQITTSEYTTFKVSDNVTMYKVTFKNQYKLNVTGHLFISKNLNRNVKHLRLLLDIQWEL